MWEHESPGHGHAKIAIFFAVGFADRSGLDSTSVLGLVVVRMARASGLRRKAGAFICCESVVFSRKCCARS